MITSLREELKLIQIQCVDAAEKIATWRQMDLCRHDMAKRSSEQYGFVVGYTHSAVSKILKLMEKNK